MKVWRSILVLALVFVAGAAAGVFGARLLARHEARQAMMHPERPQQALERMLTWRLRLDTNQQSKLHVLMTESRKDLENLYRKVQPEAATVRRTMDSQIMAMLTPEQRDLFQQMRQQNHGWFRPMMPRPPGGKAGPKTESPPGAPEGNPKSN